MRNHEKQARQFIDLVKKAGGIVASTKAQTGTVYVTVEGSFKARFADHGECYCSEDVSVDPQGHTMLQALRACAAETGLDLSRSIKVRESIAAKKEAAAAIIRAEREIADAQHREESAAERELQFATILARYPDYNERSAKARKRIRQKINADLGLYK